jgi:beta-galactosidase
MRLWVIALLTLLASPSFAARSTQLFDFDWRFVSGDFPGAERPEFDDARWQSVNLPHDFAIYGAFDKDAPNGKWHGFRPLGVGWYRKAFRTPDALEGKRVWLDFEGVYRWPKVWVNGALVAEQLSGFHGFSCDITKLLKPNGQQNIVAVRADNSVPTGVTWYTGGGIYRHVRLIVAGEVHIARHGTFVTTPKITPREAQVNAQTEIINASAEKRAATLTSEVLDANGKSAARVTSSLPIEPGAKTVFSHSLSVPNPQLWDIKNPVLYKLVSRVTVDGQASDDHETAFGIREIRVTPNGLLLNGKRVLVKGFNIHHDNGCLGAAAFDRAIERRLQVMKEIGCNAVRLSHNPHAPGLLDLCDRLGILVFNEAFCNWDDAFYGKHSVFAARWREDLAEFIRRDRNHPSVFVWSVGNQVSQAERAPDYGCVQFDAMASAVKGLDSTRPVTSALRPIRRDGKGGEAARFAAENQADIHQMALRMDVMSANYMEKWFARDRLKYPELAYIASECTTGDNGRSPWRDIDRENAVGLFYWGGINYLGESYGWPLKCWNGGFVDWAGFRRPSSWVLESLISEKPMVRLVVNRPETKFVNWDGITISLSGLLMHWNFPPGSKQEVEIISNAEEVELLLNGQSLGIKKRVGEAGLGPRHFWGIVWQPGTLTAIARNNGQEVARHELKTAGAAKAIRLTPDRAVLRADGQDLSHITVEVVDANGVVVPDAANLISFKVNGAGSNAGVQNSDVLSDELFQADTRSAFQGRALLVVRSQRQPGTITVQATAEGLAPGTLALNSQTP